MQILPKLSVEVGIKNVWIQGDKIKEIEKMPAKKEKRDLATLTAASREFAHEKFETIYAECGEGSISALRV